MQQPHPGDFSDRSKRTYLINSTEVQNPWCKLDDKCLCLSYVFDSVLVCAKSAHVLQKLSTRFADFVSN